MGKSVGQETIPERSTTDKYFSLIEHAADAIAIIQDGVFKLVNSALVGISGYDKEELLGMPFIKLLTPESQNFAMARYRDRLAGKEVPSIYETEAVTKDGEVRNIEITAVLTEYEGRIADEVIIRDITERKRVEEQTRRQNKFLNKVLDSLAHPFYVIDANDYTIKLANEAAISGRLPENITCYALIHKSSKPCQGEGLVCPLEEVRKTRKPVVVEHIHYDKNGNAQHVEFHSYPIFDSEGNVVEVLAYCLDITERKQAEEALKESEARYRALINLGGEVGEAVIMVEDTEEVVGLQTFVSDEWSRITGYSRKELLGMSFFDIVHPKDRATCLGRHHRRKQGESVPGLYEISIVRKDGTEVPIEITAAVTTYQGKPANVGYIRDITERKRAEEALQESEENLRTYLESAPDGVYLNDLKGTFLYGNKKAEEIMGYKREELVGKSFLKLNLLPAKYLAKAGKLLALNAMGRPTGPDELELRRKDGSHIWAEINTTPIKQGGKVVVIGFVRDITKRKQAEQEMRVKDSAIASSINAIAIADLEGNLTYVNHAFLRMWGYDDEKEILGKNAVEFWQSEDKALEVVKALEEKEGWVGELVAKRKDGSFFDTQVSTSIVMDETGKLTCMMASFVDITERKRAEEAMRESEEKLRRMFESVTDGITITDLNGIITKVNERIVEIHGFGSKDEILGKSAFEFIAQSDHERAAVNLQKTLEQESVRDIEYTLLRADGSEFPGELSASVLKDASGNPVGFIGITRDITDRKRVEEALHQSDERFRQIVENAQEWIWEADAKGMYTYASSVVESILGYTPEEIVGKKHFYDLFHPEDKEKLRKAAFKVFANKQSFRGFLNRNIHKNGSVVWLSTSGVPILDGKGNLLGYRGADTNITERKQAEEALRESEEKYRRLVEHIKDAVYTLDREGRFTYFGPRFEDITGYRPQDLIGHSFTEVLAPEYIESTVDRFRQGLSGETTPLYEVELLRRDGRRLPIELNVTSILDAKGQPIGRLGVVRDITERKQAEEALRESEEKYKALFEQKLDGVVVIDETMKLLLANQAAAEIFGLDSAEELLEVNLFDHILPEERERILKIITKDMFENDLQQVNEFRLTNKAGNEIWISAVGTLIQYQGKVAGLASFRDITERKRAEEREKQLQQELTLTSRLASIGQMASGVAHEINNPLTGVIGFSQLLMRRDIPDDIRDDLQVINSEAQRVARIVEGLLTFARQHKPGREYVDINHIISSVLELRSYEMKVNNIEVMTQFAPDLPQTLADGSQLQQVFLNITLNAEREMITAHNRGRLLVKTEKIGDSIRVSFTDDGPGISKENLDKIFDPFFTTREVGDGTGLGLSICHGIVTQHNGRIYAKSKLGKGATLVVELPIVADTGKTEKTRVIDEEPSKKNGAKVLVVDDEKTILAFLKHLLTEQGCEVATTGEAHAAVERLRSEKYDLILLDIKMPVMDGIELYHHIEATDPALAQRVIFITGDLMETTTKDFLNKTKAPHIAKPFDIEQLKKDINHILSKDVDVQ